MRPSQITKIILRLFALFWFLTGSIHFISSFFADQRNQGYWFFLIPGIAMLVISVILWMAAPFLGKLICGSDDEANVLREISYQQFLTAMLVGLGVYFCLSSFGGIFNWLHFFAIERSNPGILPEGLSRRYYNLTKDAVTFGAGVFVIATARKWSGRLSK